MQGKDFVGETVDIATFTAEGRPVPHDCSGYRIRVNDQSHQVDKPTMACEEVVSMVAVDSAEKVCVCVQMREAKPRVLQPGENIDLTSPGIECFNVHKKRVVEVSINSTTIQLEVPTTGEEVKQAAIEAGVRIESDFVLFLEREDGQSDQIDDADLVIVKEGVCFVALTGDDNS